MDQDADCHDSICAIDHQRRALVTRDESGRDKERLMPCNYMVPLLQPLFHEIDPFSQSILFLLQCGLTAFAGPAIYLSLPTFCSIHCWYSRVVGRFKALSLSGRPYVRLDDLGISDLGYSAETHYDVVRVSKKKRSRGTITFSSQLIAGSILVVS
ncbi:hypothetical protein ElyMa_001620800 [Elysia marginata]|uniref:Uncharacterized protein n=1 Tax=Elysia marginata TaxID=1093978 RepID=A0AAV4JMM0_9GAST|nr:hypothetical protein ElyMa_001620800 [Elysia marginata]